MSQEHDKLALLLEQGQVLHNQIHLIKENLFSSYSEFQKHFKLLNGKIDSFNTYLNELLLIYPNNNETAYLISIFGSLKKILKSLENSIKPNQINGETWLTNYPKLFKRPLSSPYNQYQKDYIENRLSLFAGSLNFLNDELNGNLKTHCTATYFPSHNVQ